MYGAAANTTITGNISKGSWVYPISTHRVARNTIVTGNVVESEYGGILIRSAGAIVNGNVVRCPVDSGSYGISLWYTGNEVIVSGNYVYGANIGIYVANITSGEYGEQLLISNNIVRNTKANGIYLTDANNFSIDGNIVTDTVDNSAGQGIRITDSKYGIISNNLVVTKASNGGGTAIFVDSASSGASSEIMVEGNTVRLTSGTVTGISIDSDATYVTCGMNMLRSCSTKYGSNTGSTNRFLDVDSEYGGILTISSGAVTVKDGVKFYTIDTEASAATDDLTTINGGTEGQIVTFKSVTNSRDPTFKDSGTNMYLAGDFTLDSSADTITLVKAGSYWYEVARSNNN
jgi:parallel beta-helix repeat protein